MSTHMIEVVPIKLEPHPNADTLSIVRVYKWTVVVKTEDWKDKETGVYIPPDYVVPDTEQFKFLNGHNRITVRRYRGIVSQGLLMPAPEGSKVGDNVIDIMGIKRYEPPEYQSGGDNVSAPPGIYPKYDIESYQRYSHLLISGEEIIVTEKIHGENSRFVFVDGQMYCGSHFNWKKDTEVNTWWKVLRNNMWIENFCKENPGYCLYGETFGHNKGMKYGCTNERKVLIFDIWDGGKFLDFNEVEKISHHLKWVPILYRGPYSEETVLKYVDGNSVIQGSNHRREGVVIRPVNERYSDEVGRVQLKIVSDRYLEKAEN